MPVEIDYTQVKCQQCTRSQRLFRAFLFLLFRILSRLDVEGYNNIPNSGHLIVVINHLHWIDIPLGLMMIPRPAVIFSKRKWKRVFFSSWFMNLMGKAIYVEDSSDIKSIRQAVNVLKSNGVLGIAPEGTRSKTGRLGKGNIGVAYLATRTSAPILPMVMYGQEKTTSYLSRFKRVPIHVRIGKPFVIQSDKTNRDDLEAHTQDIMKTLSNMLPSEYQGIYSE